MAEPTNITVTVSGLTPLSNATVPVSSQVETQLFSAPNPTVHVSSQMETDQVFSPPNPTLFMSSQMRAQLFRPLNLRMPLSAQMEIQALSPLLTPRTGEERQRAPPMTGEKKQRGRPRKHLHPISSDVSGPEWILGLGVPGLDGSSKKTPKPKLATSRRSRKPKSAPKKSLKTNKMSPETNNTGGGPSSVGGGSSSVKPDFVAGGSGSSSVGGGSSSVAGGSLSYGSSSSVKPDFQTHIIRVETNENVAEKMISFMNQAPQQEIWIISAAGIISGATLREPSPPRKLVRHQGLYEIATLQGSFVPYENSEINSHAGQMNVLLLGQDGRPLKGNVLGCLIAAAPVEIGVGIFTGEDRVRKAKKQKRTGHEEAGKGKQTVPIGEDMLETEGLWETMLQDFLESYVRGDLMQEIIIENTEPNDTYMPTFRETSPSVEFYDSLERLQVQFINTASDEDIFEGFKKAENEGNMPSTPVNSQGAIMASPIRMVEPNAFFRG